MWGYNKLIKAFGLYNDICKTAFGQFARLADAVRMGFDIERWLLRPHKVILFYIQEPFIERSRHLPYFQQIYQTTN